MLDPLSSLDEILKGKILLINKPKNWTSFDVVKKLNQQLNKNIIFQKLKLGMLALLIH